MSAEKPAGLGPQAEPSPILANGAHEPQVAAAAQSNSSAPEGPAAAARRQSHTETPAVRKQPQRKQSVFSFNGFPEAASLLLEQQQPLKSRHTPADQDASSSVKPAQVKDASSSIPSGGVLHATTSAPPVAASAQSARVPQVRAMDNLGSTGSSRASSCDEPSLASTSSAGSQQKPQQTAASSSAALEKTPTGDTSLDAVRGLQASSSSSSSLNSMSWCSEQAYESGKSNNVVRSSSSPHEDDEDDSMGAEAASKPEQVKAGAALQQNTDLPLSPDNKHGSHPPPFEPIANQLKQLNAAPNAKFIERHINNLISQNEAIIDNCNLISIRSYNSSQQQAAKRLSVSAASTATTTNSNTNHSVADKSPSDTIARLASTSGAAPKPPQQQRSSKRWSTSGVPSSSAPLCSIAIDRQHVDIRSEMNSYESNSRNYKPENHVLKQLTERKRSYNAPMPPTVALADPTCTFATNLLPDFEGPNSSLHANHQLPLKPRPSPRSKSPQATTLDSTLELMLRLNETKQQQHQQQHQQSYPLQLEDAIQNLSLKRKEEELQHHHHQQQLQQTSRTHLDQQQQPVEAEDMTTDCTNNNKSPHHQHHYNHHHHHHHHRSYSIAGQNLISATAATQQRSCQDQQLMAAALLLSERFRQSFVEQQMSLENQALFHQQQQQMIEQQLQQFRFAAALKQHQLQLNSENRGAWDSKEEQTQLVNGLFFSGCNQTDLSILKRQLLLVPQSTMEASAVAGVSAATDPNAGTNCDYSRPRESLPFKKRKISEPDLRY